MRFYINRENRKRLKKVDGKQLFAESSYLSKWKTD
jgi:hypothetical protein